MVAITQPDLPPYSTNFLSGMGWGHLYLVCEILTPLVKYINLDKLERDTCTVVYSVPKEEVKEVQTLLMYTDVTYKSRNVVVYFMKLD